MPKTYISAIPVLARTLDLLSTDVHLPIPVAPPRPRIWHDVAPSMVVWGQVDRPLFHIDENELPY